MASSSPKGRRRACSTIPASSRPISESRRAMPPEATALREERRAAPTAPGDTLVALLARNAAAHGAAIALRERDLGIWRDYSWRDYLREVLAFAAGLEALGFAPGEPLMVIGDNPARLSRADLSGDAGRGARPFRPRRPRALRRGRGPGAGRQAARAARAHRRPRAHHLRRPARHRRLGRKRALHLCRRRRARAGAARRRAGAGARAADARAA